MPKLTKSVVDAARPRESQFTVWCSELKGFGVFVHPTGKRTYFVDYRNAQSVRRRLTIGRHGVVTAEEARRLALAALGGVARGEDPADERARRRKAMTVSELCQQYLTAAGQGLILGKGNRPNGGPGRVRARLSAGGRRTIVSRGKGGQHSANTRISCPSSGFHLFSKAGVSRHPPSPFWSTR